MNPIAKSRLKRAVRSVLTAFAGIAVVNSLWAVVCALAVHELIPGELVFHTTIVVPCLALACVILAILKDFPSRVTVPVLALSVPFLIYLGWDDSNRPQPTELPPLISEGSQIETAMRWLQKGHPQNRLSEAPKDPELSPNADDWRALNKGKVDSILATIENDQLGRDWIRIMSESTPDGIMPPSTGEPVYLNVNTVRTIYRLRWFQAARLAQEGHVDDAARVLIPLIRASHNMHRTGCSLVEQMIADVCRKGSYMQVLSAAHAGSFSDAAREEVLEAVRAAPSVTDNLTLAFIGERSLATSQLDLQNAAAEGQYLFPSDWFPMTVQLGIFGRLVFNPNRTQNEYVAFLSDSLALALKPRRMR